MMLIYPMLVMRGGPFDPSLAVDVDHGQAQCDGLGSDAAAVGEGKFGREEELARTVVAEQMREGLARRTRHEECADGEGLAREGRGKATVDHGQSLRTEDDDVGREAEGRMLAHEAIADGCLAQGIERALRHGELSARPVELGGMKRRRGELGGGGEEQRGASGRDEVEGCGAVGAIDAHVGGCGSREMGGKQLGD